MYYWGFWGGDSIYRMDLSKKRKIRKEYKTTVFLTSRTSFLSISFFCSSGVIDVHICPYPYRSSYSYNRYSGKVNSVQW